MADYSKWNRAEVLRVVEELIKEQERYKAECGYYPLMGIRQHCEVLSIFDWWKDYLRIGDLKQMRAFLRAAGKLGYDGYVCFRVGVQGCSHGMWAHKQETTTGHSPDGEVLFHSFRSGDNYFDVQLPDGRWGHQIDGKCEHTLAEIKQLLGK